LRGENDRFYAAWPDFDSALVELLAVVAVVEAPTPEGLGRWHEEEHPFVFSLFVEY
jgi:hypothetical protein